MSGELMAKVRTEKEAKKAYAAASKFDAAERDRLLMEQLPQVRYITRRIHDRLPQHVALEDLIHAGVLGLIDALDKFDPSKHVQLKSYAKFRIRGAILDSLRKMDWSPRELRKKARQMEQAHHTLHARLGREATEPELAAEMGMTLEKFQRLLGDLRGLDLGCLQVESAENGREQKVVRYQPNGPDEDPFGFCLREELKSLLAGAIGELPLRDRRVLALYYLEELTMKEVGRVLGVGESRISQIHSAALVRLRSRMQKLIQSQPSPETASQEPRQAAAGAQ